MNPTDEAEEQFTAELNALPMPALDERLAEKVLAMARGELVGPAESVGTRLRRNVGGALVPALLTSAAGCRTALTVETAKAAFGSVPTSSENKEPVAVPPHGGAVLP